MPNIIGYFFGYYNCYKSNQSLDRKEKCSNKSQSLDSRESEADINTILRVCRVTRQALGNTHAGSQTKH